MPKYKNDNLILDCHIKFVDFIICLFECLKGILVWYNRDTKDLIYILINRKSCNMILYNIYNNLIYNL